MDWKPSIDDLPGVLGPIGYDAAKATWLIDSAARELLARVPTLAAPTPQQRSLAKDVVLRAVARVLRNPAAAAGLRRESEGGYSYELDPRDASANIWFPDSDLALLRGGAGLGFGSMTVQRGLR